MRHADECVLGSINYLQSVPFRFNHEQISCSVRSGTWPFDRCVAVS